MFTVTAPISPPAEAKLPEFTPPPDILPPLKSEIGGDCTPLVVAAGPRAANKLPSSNSLSNEKVILLPLWGIVKNHICIIYKLQDIRND